MEFKVTFDDVLFSLSTKRPCNAGCMISLAEEKKDCEVHSHFAKAYNFILIAIVTAEAIGPIPMFRS